MVVALLGGALAYRGIGGHCHLYQALGVDTTGDRAVRGNLGIKIDRAVRVDAPPERVYGVWRNLENLPRLLRHVERVEVLDRTRSHWTVRAPAGMTVGWDAEIINDKANELIAWRSLDNRWVQHAGAVNFDRGPDGRSTLVRVSLQYDPPGGMVGHAVAGLFARDPETEIDEDLASFKRALEAGTLAA
jgi:uncharacterized membrane protein